ncbi:MAG: nuclear transport factor 2 family protein [Nocardioidaceae bacterium]|nr:nuclear transport factor 2 family protein [Nocardioidaceae bacterium]
MEAVEEVRRAAEARAAALVAGDAGSLRLLLHERFRWTTHTGLVIDRDEYVRRNTEGVAVWRSQALGETQIAIVGDTAVLLTVVTDVVVGSQAEDEELTMPMTQVWVRVRDTWRCLAGHGGPRLH